MIAEWEDSYNKEYPFGHSLCSVKHNGKRPTFLIIKLDEIVHHSFHNYTLEYYLIHHLPRQLCKGGSIVINTETV